MRTITLAAVGPLLLAPVPQSGGAPAEKAPEFIATAPGAAWSTSRKESIAVGPGSSWSIVTVVVQNVGRIAVEPLAFRVEYTAQGRSNETEVLRVPSPFGKRLGRPVVPGGELEYKLLVPLPPEVAKSASFNVTKEQCFRGEYKIAPKVKAVSKAPLPVKSIKLGRNVTHTLVKVENKGDRATDAVFRAQFRTPKDTQALYTVRLEPQSTKDWVIDSIPGGPGGENCDVDINKLELVDWCELFGGDFEREMGAAPSSRKAAPDAVGAPPTGADADILRTAWNAPYRYPDAKVRIRGDYSAENPATDLVWRGRRKVSGTFLFDGFTRGFWESRAVTVQSPDLGEPEQKALGDVVADRMMMWFAVDLTGRAAFESAFAGASLRRERNSMFPSSGPFEQIDVESGKMIKLVKQGRAADYAVEYVQLGTQCLTKCYRRGEERLEATWLRVAPGWYFPETLEFSGVFGKGWGPERIKLSNIKIEPK